MKPLSVKGKADEIEIVFEEEISFADALAELETLTKDQTGFFQNSNISISYRGISLSYNQERILEEKLKQNFGNRIRLIKQHILSLRQIEYSLKENEKICLVIEKSLRSGETVESRGDVIIHGDVNPGAYVKARGNITVLGALRGVAHITKEGKVYATYMQPSQIRIGKVCSYNKKNENVAAAIAIAENGEIILQCL